MEDDSKQIAELKELMRRSIAISEETNQIVHGMRRAARLSSLLRWGWWILVFVVSGVTYYYYFQPYVDRIEQAYAQVQSGAQQAADWQTQMNYFFKNLFGGK
jgi:type II secretory pathway component PulM